MKVKEKAEARKLRKEKGYSIKQIARELKVSQSSVSYWVRDIELTEGQKKVLEYNFKVKNSYESRQAGAEVLKHRYKKIRENYQEEGKKQARKNEPLHAMGCMLYWAEGFRKNNKNYVKISNSDPYLISLFKKFIETYFNVESESFSICLGHYDDLVSLKIAEEYWLKKLNLPKKCMKKSTLNNMSYYSKKKRCGSLKYGTCHLMVFDTRIIQHIYGAIQEYGKFNRPEWLGGRS